MERRSKGQPLPVQERQELVASGVPEAILAGGGHADAALRQVVQRPWLSQEIGVIEVRRGLQDSELVSCASIRRFRALVRRRCRVWRSTHKPLVSAG